MAGIGTYNDSALDAVLTEYDSKYNELFMGGFLTTFDKVAGRRQTDQMIVRDTFYKNYPMMEKWIDGRRNRSVKAVYAETTLEEYDLSLEIDWGTWASNPVGLKEKLRRHIADTAKHLDKIVWEAIENGDNVDAYTGSSFLGTHTLGDFSLTNTSTDSYDGATVKDIIRQFRRIPDDNGEPLGLAPDVLVVAPDDLESALEDFNATERVVPVDTSGNRDATSSVQSSAVIPNVWRTTSGLTIVENKRWIVDGTNRGHWGLFVTNNGDMPVYLYEHSNAPLRSRPEEDRPDADRADPVVKVGADAILGVSLVAPELVYLSKATS